MLSVAAHAVASPSCWLRAHTFTTTAVFYGSSTVVYYRALAVEDSAAYHSSSISTATMTVLA
jgi:hypothetical protein